MSGDASSELKCSSSLSQKTSGSKAPLYLLSLEGTADLNRPLSRQFLMQALEVKPALKHRGCSPHHACRCLGKFLRTNLQIRNLLGELKAIVAPLAVSQKVLIAG